MSPMNATPRFRQLSNGGQIGSDRFSSRGQVGVDGIDYPSIEPSLRCRSVPLIAEAHEGHPHRGSVDDHGSSLRASKMGRSSMTFLQRAPVGSAAD